MILGLKLPDYKCLNAHETGKVAERVTAKKLGQISSFTLEAIDRNRNSVEQKYPCISIHVLGSVFIISPMQMGAKYDAPTTGCLW